MRRMLLNTFASSLFARKSQCMVFRTNMEGERTKRRTKVEGNRMYCRRTMVMAVGATIKLESNQGVHFASHTGQQVYVIVILLFQQIKERYASDKVRET